VCNAHRRAVVCGYCSAQGGANVHGERNAHGHADVSGGIAPLPSTQALPSFSHPQTQITRDAPPPCRCGVSYPYVKKFLKKITLRGRRRDKTPAFREMRRQSSVAPLHAHGVTRCPLTQPPPEPLPSVAGVGKNNSKHCQDYRLLWLRRNTEIH